MRIREFPGTVMPPHSHPVDEHITVVQGTWYFSLGEHFDASALQELRAGGYAFAPKGSSMFGYSPDEAIVQVHGIGPFEIHWRDPVKSLDDADTGSTFHHKRVAARIGNHCRRLCFGNVDPVRDRGFERTPIHGA